MTEPDELQTILAHTGFCPTHWTRLRESIRQRGLLSYVAPNAAEAMRRLELTHTNGIDSAQTFEPLLEASMGIYRSTMHNTGGKMPAGCVLCSLGGQFSARVVRQWIRQATNEAFMHAMLLELIPWYRRLWWFMTGGR
jgi:hypothetical protein